MLNADLKGLIFEPVNTVSVSTGSITALVMIYEVNDWSTLTSYACKVVGASFRLGTLVDSCDNLAAISRSLLLK